MTEQTSKCLAWTPNTEAHSSWRWLLDEIWRQLCYLFMSFPAWRFHGPICFNPHECCRRKRFLFTLIKIIFCGARSNGQNVKSMTLFSPPAAITQQAALLFASSRAAKDASPRSCMLVALSVSHVVVQIRLYGAYVTMPVFFCLFFYFIFWVSPVNILKSDRFRAKQASERWC